MPPERNNRIGTNDLLNQCCVFSSCLESMLLRKPSKIFFQQYRPIPDIDVSDRDFFKVYQSNPDQIFFISEPIRNRATGSWIVPFTRKISGPNGEFLGLISAALELEYFDKYFSEITFEAGSGMGLFRKDGILFTRIPRIESDIGRRFPDATSLKLVSTADHAVGMNMDAIDGHLRIVAAHRVGRYPVVVAITKTTAAVFADWKQTAVYVICISVLTIVAIAAFAFLFIRMFRNYQSLVRARAAGEKAEQFREQSQRFDVALSNMAQGLVMFDASERIVLCNQRYIEMYGLSPDVVKPGCTFRELLRHRQELGIFLGDVEEFHRELLNNLARKEMTSIVIQSAAGQSFRVVNMPMAGGGWVATHEDITEQVIAKNLNEKQKLQFDTALENMSQGLLMFDASARIVICNERYIQMYGLSPEVVKPGLTFLELIQHRAESGSFTGDPHKYCSEIRVQIADRQVIAQTVETGDGRLIHIVNQPMADGGWVATHEDVTVAKRREESFQLLFEGNPVPMWVFDRESLRFLAVNDAAVTHYGYSREQFMTMTVPDLRPAEQRGSYEHFLRTLSDAQITSNTGQHWRSDGTVIDVAVNSRCLNYAGRQARLSAIHDITSIKLAEDELRRTKKFLDTVIDHVPLPIIVKDVPSAATDALDCRFALVNRAYEEFSGDARAQVIGKSARELFPEGRAAIIVASDSKTLQSNEAVTTDEHSILAFNNAIRLITAKKVAIRDDDGKPRYLLSVLDDVTERRRSEQRISYMAHYDTLTDLPNRASFNSTIDHVIDQAAKTGDRFTLLSIDLDRFKEINDVYGHIVGDALLKETARRLQAAAGGSFIARLGGDEFMLIVTDGDQPAAAAALADRLLAALVDEFEIDGHQLKLGLSMGGAVYPADGTDVKTLLLNADTALYRAKTEVLGSALFFEAEMGAQLRERRALKNDLQSVVDRGELLLHYQPQSKTAGETIGFEALVRWQCPKRGMIPPGSFIPIAEESHLIIPIGEWVLREACREAASWPQPLTIAVNISPVQFHHGDLPNLVHSILFETGLAAARLELEITEGVLIDDFSRAVSILNKLKSLGIKIAMDDFGSGYSSLSYLHSFPFDKIKIDHSFIGDLEHNRHSIAIVRAVIGLGHSLNVPVLAEGVETETQHAFLAQEGCDEVQGYLIGRPRPIADYSELVGRAANAKQVNAAVAG